MTDVQTICLTIAVCWTQLMAVVYFKKVNVDTGAKAGVKVRSE